MGKSTLISQRFINLPPFQQWACGGCFNPKKRDAIPSVLAERLFLVAKDTLAEQQGERGYGQRILKIGAPIQGPIHFIEQTTFNLIVKEHTPALNLSPHDVFEFLTWLTFMNLENVRASEAFLTVGGTAFVIDQVHLANGNEGHWQGNTYFLNVGAERQSFLYLAGLRITLTSAAPYLDDFDIPPFDLEIVTSSFPELCRREAKALAVFLSGVCYSDGQVIAVDMPAWIQRLNVARAIRSHHSCDNLDRCLERIALKDRLSDHQGQIDSEPEED